MKALRQKFLKSIILYFDTNCLLTFLLKVNVKFIRYPLAISFSFRAANRFPGECFPLRRRRPPPSGRAGRSSSVQTAWPAPTRRSLAQDRDYRLGNQD